MIALVKKLLAEHNTLQAQLAADPRFMRMQELKSTLRVLSAFEPDARATKATGILREVQALLALEGTSAPPEPAARPMSPKKPAKTKPKPPGGFVMPAIVRVLAAAPEALPMEVVLTRVQAAGGIEASDPSPKRTLAVVLANGVRYGRVRKTAAGEWTVTAKGRKEAET